MGVGGSVRGEERVMDGSGGSVRGEERVGDGWEWGECERGREGGVMDGSGGV